MSKKSPIIPRLDGRPAGKAAPILANKALPPLNNRAAGAKERK